MLYYDRLTNLVLARLNNAIDTFTRLQLHGMKEDQILRISRAIELSEHILNSNYMQSLNPHFGGKSVTRLIKIKPEPL